MIIDYENETEVYLYLSAPVCPDRMRSEEQAGTVDCNSRHNRPDTAAVIHRFRRKDDCERHAADLC